MAFPSDAARVECCADGGMVGETLHNGDDVGVLVREIRLLPDFLVEVVKARRFATGLIKIG